LPIIIFNGQYEGTGNSGVVVILQLAASAQSNMAAGYLYYDVKTCFSAVTNYWQNLIKCMSLFE
jgi:hypothetical protein